jgi:hypothetical protein
VISKELSKYLKEVVGGTISIIPNLMSKNVIAPIMENSTYDQFK